MRDFVANFVKASRFNVLISEEHSSRFSLKSNKPVTQSVRLGDSRKNKPRVFRLQEIQFSHLI